MDYYKKIDALKSTLGDRPGVPALAAVLDRHFNSSDGVVFVEKTLSEAPIYVEIGTAIEIYIEKDGLEGLCESVLSVNANSPVAVPAILDAIATAIALPAADRLATR